MTDLNKFENLILDCFKKADDWQSIKMVADEIGLNWNTTGKYVLLLEAKGFVESKDFGKIKLFRHKGGKK